MDKEKIKLIIRNMELLLDTLKVDLLSDTSVEKVSEIILEDMDYDEIYYE
jgi:hypothetical protein